MCGRFAQVIKHDQLKKLQDELKLKEISEQIELNYNVAPTQTVSAAVAKGDVRYMGFFRWGLIPSWMREVPTSALINVRSDTILDKPSFKASFLRRRCLIPANGFYEWRKGDKQPFFIHAEGDGLIYMAGIFDAWTSPEGSFIPSLGIITVDADDVMQSIHSRMPLILPSSMWDAWLEPSNQNAEMLKTLLNPNSELKLTYHPVSKYVNSISNNSETCMQIVEPQAVQSDIFS